MGRKPPPLLPVVVQIRPRRFKRNMVDSFRRLLYDISKQLSNEEVIDLIYLCKVPSSAKTKIQDAKDLFKYLEESGIINDQRIHTLKKVLNLLRPKRQDLLDLVDKKFPQDDRRSDRSISICTTNTINTVTSDTSGYSFVARSNNKPVTQKQLSINGAVTQKRYFNVDCYCIQFYGCSITKPFCCCYGMTIFLLFLLLTSVIFWFSGKPKTVYSYLNAKEYRKDIGFILVSALSFLLLIVIAPYLLRKHGRRIFSWCNRKRSNSIGRTLGSRRQLLRESQAITPEQSPRNTAIELNNKPSVQSVHDVENPVLNTEAQRSEFEIQTSSNEE